MFTAANGSLALTQHGIDQSCAHYYDAARVAPSMWWPQRSLSEVVSANGGSATVCRVPLPNGQVRLNTAEDERRTTVGCAGKAVLSYTTPKIVSL